MSINVAEAKMLQQEFAHYLKTHYSYAHPGHMASEVMYVYRHSIGIPFEQIFADGQSMESARKLLINHFEKIGRKNPKGDASVHFNDWTKFKEFLDVAGRSLA